MTIKEKLKTLPSSPGVYLMKGSDQNIIYVGKSKNLKHRVATYFHPPDADDKKAQKLYHSIKSFDILTTDTELEALLLECQLIKKYKPWCNRLMKNPDSYVYIKITIEEEYPDLLLCEEMEQDGSLYFGPYVKRSRTEYALDTIRTIYKMPCTKYSRKTTSCLNYSLGTCNGICIGKLSKEQHRIYIQEIIAFLTGSNTVLIDELEEKMQTAAAAFEFEQAARLRDQITTLTGLIKQAALLSFASSHPLFLVAEPLSCAYYKVLVFDGTRELLQKKIPLDSTQKTEAVKEAAAKLIPLLPKTKQTSPLTKQDLDEFRILYGYLTHHQNGCRYTTLNSDSNTEITNDFLIDSLLSLL